MRHRLWGMDAAGQGLNAKALTKPRPEPSRPRPRLVLSRLEPRPRNWLVFPLPPFRPLKFGKARRRRTGNDISRRAGLCRVR